MVPNGWSQKTLEDLSIVERGKFSARPRNDPRYFGGEMPFVQTGDVTGSKTYLNSFTQTLNQDGIGVSKVFPKGTILITIAANIGDTAITSFDVACPDSVVAIQPYSTKADTYWLKNVLDTKKEDLDSQSTQNAQKNINLQVLKPLVILTPPLSEQKKIAKILSTWDKAISTTEQLLANSQQQKKALMQQLLTGKKRLLDNNGVRFSGEWKKSTLGNLGNTFNGLTGKTKDDFGFGKKYIPYINIFKNSRIDLEALDLVDVKEGESQSLTQFGDIFFTTSSETPDEVGMSSVLLDQVDEVYLNSFCFGFRLFDFKSLLPEFARYLLRSENIRSEIAVLGQGATRYNLSKKQLMKLELVLPNINEQKKIATILSTADQEIASLQQKLDTLKQEKKALMQQLLTGKRRVKVNA